MKCFVLVALLVIASVASFSLRLEDSLSAQKHPKRTPENKESTLPHKKDNGVAHRNTTETNKTKHVEKKSLRKKGGNKGKKGKRSFAEGQKVGDLLPAINGLDYVSFVNALSEKMKTNGVETKAEIVAKALAHHLSLTTQNKVCSELIPTQNEVDVTKSISFPLKHVASMRQFLDCGTTAQTINGNKIVTNGKYIIDGHHRWSSASFVNPACILSALDITGLSINEPSWALKSAQYEVASETGAIAVQVVNGQNLLTIGEEDLKKMVKDTIKPDVLEEVKTKRNLADIDAVANFFWANVKSLQANNQPMPGASKRDYMPQTTGTFEANVGTGMMPDASQ
jgi:hypothetical protein